MTSEEPQPHIVYWRDQSAEAGAVVATLKNEKWGGEVNTVETSAQFLKALEHPQTQLIVTHEPQLTGEILKNVRKNSPDAVLVVVCQDEKLIPQDARNYISHLLGTHQLDELAPLLKRVLGQTSRLWSLKNSCNLYRQSSGLLEALPDALIVSGLDEKISVWNAGAEKLFGWTAAEALGQKAAQLLASHLEDSGRLPALKDGGDWSGEVTYNTKDGHKIDVFARRLWVKNTSADSSCGAFMELSTPLSVFRTLRRRVGRDTQLHTLLRGKSSLHQRLREAVRKLSEDFGGWCLLDLESSEGALTRVACTSHEASLCVLCESMLDDMPIFSSDRRTAAGVLRSGSLEVTQPLDKLADYLGVTDPAQRAQLESLNPVWGLAVPLQVLDKVAGILILLNFDPTKKCDLLEQAVASQLASLMGFAVECEALEKRVANQGAKFEATSIKKDAFLGTLSHELRTPLQAMLGWTQLLRDKQLKPKFVEKALDSLEQSIKAQSKIVNDLLDVSRINSGKLHLSVRPTLLIPLLESALNAFQVAASIKQIQLTLTAPPDSKFWIQADTIWLQRAFWNILSNSIKFTPGGGKVEVLLSKDDGFVHIYFKDTGVGIEAQHLPQVFDYFSQADSSTTRVHEGLGVGMVISRFVVEAHGGTIAAASQGKDEGATFSLKLPLCEPPGTAAPDVISALVEPENADATSLSGIRILLVEDEADTRDMLQFVFSQAGAQVIEAPSAKVALAALLASAFDVLVSDIGMPNEDGYSLIRRVRALPPDLGGLIPALALTAYATKEDRLQALRAGFQGYAPKPVDVNELLLMVKSLVQKAALRDC